MNSPYKIKKDAFFLTSNKIERFETGSPEWIFPPPTLFKIYAMARQHLPPIEVGVFCPPSESHPY
jgi:hypothetical protein